MARAAAVPFSGGVLGFIGFHGGSVIPYKKSGKHVEKYEG
jgi:hypothetical protein